MASFARVAWCLSVVISQHSENTCLLFIWLAMQMPLLTAQCLFNKWGYNDNRTICLRKAFDN